MDDEAPGIEKMTEPMDWKSLDWKHLKWWYLSKHARRRENCLE